MTDNNENKTNLQTNEPDQNEHISTSNALSDEQRVKVMSPSMLVFKRFIRNRLAVIGFCILVAMFVFSFIGPIFSPYSETQVFTKDSAMYKDYAEYSINNTWRFIIMEGSGVPATATSSAIQVMNNNGTTYTSGGVDYQVEIIQAGKYAYIHAPIDIALCNVDKATAVPTTTLTAAADITVDYQQTFTDAFVAATAAYELDNTQASFTVTYGDITLGGTQVTYTIKKDADSPRALTYVYRAQVYDRAVVCTKLVMHSANADIKPITDKYDFIDNALKIYYSQPDAQNSFMVEGNAFTCTDNSTDGQLEIKKGSDVAVLIAEYNLNPKNQTEFLTLDFKSAIATAVNAGEDSIQMPGTMEVEKEDGTVETQEVETTYNIIRDNIVFRIQSEQIARIDDIYSTPSVKHILGTDKFGMDVCTRLMYGGRVSLEVGFIVVIIELVIGVILGGLAGYFSGWVDVVIMRLIELFNCIPFYPLLMIIGSILDQMEFSSQSRIYLLMVLLGLLYWPGVARIVRGQILMLREQDFIVATEACGIPVTRRIFKHLVPNVVPLLIVTATAGLGGIIITEATLSYLGLGVKYPLASWGSIINQASEPHVMTNYWWIWAPAGLLILLTVLGFNFMGDGLRDAFDPKMKR